MHRTITKLTTATLVLLISVTSITTCMYKKEQLGDTKQGTPPGGQKLRLLIPDASWEPFFFASLEAHLKKINLSSLRTTILPNKDDLEVRFWIDGFPDTIKGFALRRVTNQWSAVYVNGKFEQQNFPLTEKPLPAPKSGWGSAWEKLVGAGILTLPDASEIKCDAISIDGIGYVVEINYNWSYRTYSYHNPQLAKCNEAKQVILIRQILSDEFTLQ